MSSNQLNKQQNNSSDNQFSVNNQNNQ
jgi:hypothetical protein